MVEDVSCKFDYKKLLAVEARTKNFEVGPFSDRVFCSRWREELRAEKEKGKERVGTAKRCECKDGGKERTKGMRKEEIILKNDQSIYLRAI